LKITVVGNCQQFSLAQCIQALMAQHDVRAIWDGAGLKDERTQKLLHESDVIVSQSEPAELITREFPEKRLILFPSIVFAGYFPDFVLAKVGDQPLASPLGNFHSSIAVWAFANGLSVSQTLRLFCADVYDALKFHDVWEASFEVLRSEGEATDVPLAEMFTKWSNHHPWLHVSFHPKLFVTIDVARHIAGKIGPARANLAPEDYVADGLASAAVWPVYPEIAERRGFRGNYTFKTRLNEDASKLFQIYDLEGFVERSFRIYRAKAPLGAIFHERMEAGKYDILNQFATKRIRSKEEDLNGARSSNLHDANLSPGASDSKNSHAEHRTKGLNSPYRNLADHQYWQQAIESTPVFDVDPVVGARFRIDAETPIASGGSCFAQHISKALAREGYNYLVTETAPHSLPAGDAVSQNYGVFSARYGNIYTARQLDQLFDRAYNNFKPQDSEWRTSKGRYVDPYRPRIEPRGYADPLEVRAARETHLAAVRQMFETMSIFIFTLGMTEAWRAKSDGAVFPLAPGVAAGEFDSRRYEFVNFGAEEVLDDMAAFIAKLQSVNPAAKVILTVSPVPLVATFEPRHVLVSTTVSKSILRTVADVLTKKFAHVDYFPSYEIITGSFSRGRYFQKDLRSIAATGVDHAMGLFARHYFKINPTDIIRADFAKESYDLTRLVCEEDDLRLSRG
jgi:hypothetical protein